MANTHQGKDPREIFTSLKLLPLLFWNFNLIGFKPFQLKLINKITCLNIQLKDNLDKKGICFHATKTQKIVTMIKLARKIQIAQHCSPKRKKPERVNLLSRHSKHDWFESAYAGCCVLKLEAATFSSRSTQKCCALGTCFVFFPPHIARRCLYSYQGVCIRAPLFCFRGVSWRPTERSQQKGHKTRQTRTARVAKFRRRRYVFGGGRMNTGTKQPPAWRMRQRWNRLESWLVNSDMHKKAKHFF